MTNSAPIPGVEFTSRVPHVFPQQFDGGEPEKSPPF